MRYLMKKQFYYAFIIVVLFSLTACSQPKTDAGEAVGLRSEAPVSVEKAETETSPMPETERNENAVSTTPVPATVKTEDTSMVRDGIETLEEYEAARYKSNGELEVSVERTSRPVTNEEGQVLGIVYYEKPVVSGDSEAVRKINAFYEREEQEWFDGYGRNTLYIDGYYSYFYDQLKDLCEQYGEEYIAQYPLQYTIKTRIMFFDEKLLSVVQIANICTGHNNCHSYGSTFDLETGELVSLDELADIDADQLKMIIDDVLSENNIYGELGGDNYVIHHYAYEAAMNYEYYYDGEKFYIILNYIEGSGDGGIVVWNGKWGEEYAVEEFGYFVQPDGETLEKIAW